MKIEDWGSFPTVQKFDFPCLTSSWLLSCQAFYLHSRLQWCHCQRGWLGYWRNLFLGLPLNYPTLSEWARFWQTSFAFHLWAEVCWYAYVCHVKYSQPHLHAHHQLVFIVIFIFLGCHYPHSMHFQGSWFLLSQASSLHIPAMQQWQAVLSLEHQLHLWYVVADGLCL